MKIIISEGGSASNVGSMALIENAIGIARNQHPQCDITVLSHDPQSVDEALKKDKIKGVKVMGDMFIIPNTGSISKMVWLIQNILWIIWTRFLLLFCRRISWAVFGRKATILKEVEIAEYIYCIGAERINDIYFKTALLSLYAINTYIKMDKKLVHLSLTIGPVFYRSTISVAKKVLNKSYAIFVRDTKSYKILKKWNCKAPYQYNAYDIAILQNTNTSLSQKLLNEFGIEPGFIGLSCIHWKFRKAAGRVRQPEYEKAIAEALDYIVEKYEKKIVCTPTVVNGKDDDDEHVGNRIIEKMRHKDAVINIKRLLTPIEMATLFTQCQFSIVTRMHAAILCSGAGSRPIIAINYLYKLREYMKNIGFEDYSVDIDYVTSADLIFFADNMMEHYNENIKALNSRQEELRKELNKYINTVWQ